jgi:hypothetical protein
MQKIFGLDQDEIEVVDIDGAPSGEKEYLVWNPPLINELQPALGRRGSIAEATALMRFLMKRGMRVLLFCKVRLSQFPGYVCILLYILDTEDLRTCQYHFCNRQELSLMLMWTRQ